MGSLHAVKAVYDDMVSRNSGHICFIASTLSLLGKGRDSSGVTLACSRLFVSRRGRLVAVIHCLPASSSM